MRKLLPLMLAVLALAVPLSADRGEAPTEEEKNKALVARFYDEVWNKGNYDVADEVFAADYVRNDPRGGNPPGGPKGQKLIARAFRKGCPDCVMTVDRLLADGEFVVGQWKISGTDQASNQKIDFVGINIFRFKDGKVVEIWNHRDDLAYMQQTGRATLVRSAEQQAPKKE
ncbi:MAG TPA: ester cyclase [Thermoanaerobaculia bacterium]|nr:ester cyclase [Thermoanaerobaculia bacterium]